MRITLAPSPQVRDLSIWHRAFPLSFCGVDKGVCCNWLAGEGDVYNTTAITRYQLPGPFVPYIYVGGPERGLAFFAESDKDWISAEPAYQIVRNTSEGMVELVVNLISANAATAGAKLTRTRTVEFGMMVAPSKPQATLGAETARGQWTRANGMPRTDPGTDGGPVGSSAALIGNSGYWGARDGDAGFYPYVVMLTVVPFLDACCHSNCIVYPHCGCIWNGLCLLSGSDTSTIFQSGSTLGCCVAALRRQISSQTTMPR